MLTVEQKIAFIEMAYKYGTVEGTENAVVSFNSAEYIKLAEDIFNYGRNYDVAKAVYKDPNNAQR